MIANISPEDERIIEETIKLEGGYVNDPDDAGGETKYGISKRQYPNVDIKNLTLEEAKAIYFRDYFVRMNLSAIDMHQVRRKLFDIGVNMGTGTAVRLLQQVLGVKEDGVLGEGTAKAIVTYTQDELVHELQKKQILRYADICAKTPSNIKFLKGWINRAYSC